MRLVAGTVLLFREFQNLEGQATFDPSPLQILKIVLGALLIAGLWTPVTGLVVVILEIGLVAGGLGDQWLHVLLMTLGICLSLLGPGGWSVDAWLFGWRRIDIPD